MKRRFDPHSTLAYSESGGVRYLHFGSPWIQGAMRLKKPFEIELEYVRNMMAWLLFMDPPAEILQLGLGAGALTRWTWKSLPDTATTVVERDEDVIGLCRQAFALPADDDRLAVVCDDGGAYVARRAHHHRFGVVQVDVYDEDARGPVLDSEGFYRHCRRCIAQPGMLVVNLFSGAGSLLEAKLERISRVFDGRMLVMPPVAAGNVIVLAFAGPPLRVTRMMWLERAEEVVKRWRLPGAAWAQALSSSVFSGA